MLNTSARVKFSAAEEGKKYNLGGSRDRRMPPERTKSFKEWRNAQNWFQRQFSRKTSQNYDSGSGIEHVTAVAAAAFAINQLEDSEISTQKIREVPGTSLTRSKSKMDDTKISTPQPGGVSKRFSGAGSIKITDGQDKNEQVTPATNEKMPEKAIAPIPSIKKAPTFGDKRLNIGTSGIKPESAAPKPTQPDTFKETLPPAATKRQISKRSGVGETKADAWETAELAKIKERYEKLNATIGSWENKKKTKSRRSLDKQESKLELKRMKTLEKFRSEREYIDQIAGGARAQAQEKRRNEELKAKEKANIIRSTGKLPGTCFCF
ncbi:Remorin like [Quillaja saponaria]|uniref:Remorin like n=1 Tax=Quillaja saponaria TaxID=32244 RepID=A0AAD7L935_QUISA|nr:Remorin like [Quillaja saponaria]